MEERHSIPEVGDFDFKLSMKAGSLNNNLDYKNYSEKVEKYFLIFWVDVQNHPDYCSKLSSPTNIRGASGKDNIFSVPDNTLDAHYGIGEQQQRFCGIKIGIIGLGGTGSYVLDLISKCPIQEIHLFDGDTLESLNLFRAPGSPEADIFSSEETIYKVDYYRKKYSAFRKGIFANSEYLDSTKFHLLENLDFYFVCMDGNAHKQELIDWLIENEKPFVDVGLSVSKPNHGKLDAQIRTSLGTPETYELLLPSLNFSHSDKDAYTRNIQIVELNCLNAALAVIAWKKYLEFTFPPRTKSINLYMG